MRIRKKKALQQQQMMMGKLKINAENMMDDYWQMNQQQPQQRKKDANATKVIPANGPHILPMPNAPPLTPSVASTSSASQINPRGFGQGLFSGQQQKSTETKGKMDKQVPMPSNQRHNIDGAGWKWRLLKILCCIFVCILIQLFYSAKLKPQQKNVLNGRIKMVNRTFSNPNRKSSFDNGKMAKDEAAIVPSAYSSYYPEFPEALFLQNDYSDFLQILPLFEEIQMDPVNFTTLLDSDELEASKKHGKLAGFEWELAMLKTRQNLLFIVISAKNSNSNARMDYNVTGEIEFYINLEYPDIGIAPNCGKEEEAQFRHKRHCIFNSLEGGKCGLLMANPERHLRRFFVGQQSQSLLAQIGVLLHLNIPPQKEAIENL